MKNQALPLQGLATEVTKQPAGEIINMGEKKPLKNVSTIYFLQITHLIHSMIIIVNEQTRECLIEQL